MCLGGLYFCLRLSLRAGPPRPATAGNRAGGGAVRRTLAGVVAGDLTDQRADGRAAVKLVDFGLARGDEAQATGLTESFVGSPAYASPEQIRSSAEVGDQRRRGRPPASVLRRIDSIR